MNPEDEGCIPGWHLFSSIVGILTFISMILVKTKSERLEARNFVICRYFSFYEELKFHVKLS